MQSFSSSLKISKIRMETNKVNPASWSTFLSCTEHCAKAGDFPPICFLKWCPVTSHSAGGSPWQGSLHSSTEVSWSKGNLAYDSLWSPSVWALGQDWVFQRCLLGHCCISNNRGLKYKTSNLFHRLSRVKNPLWPLCFLCFPGFFSHQKTDSGW